MIIPWGKKVQFDFIFTLAQIGERLQWTDKQIGFLMACIAFETGETFSPTVKNAAGSGAVGLIQFMPSTCVGLGTTSIVMESLSATQQLLYVEKYFKPYAKRTKTLSDMYMAILLPKYIGAEPDAVLFSGGIAYRQNSGLDKDKDGKVTKYEAAAKVQSKYEKGLRPEFCLGA